MGTTLATYYAKLQDMPDSEYKVDPFDHHRSPLAWSADFSFFQ